MRKKSKQQRRIALYFAAIVFLAVGLLSTLFLGTILKISRDDAQRTMQAMAETISEQLDQEIRSMDRIALGFLGNEAFMDAMVQMRVNAEDNEATDLLRKHTMQKLVDKLVFSLNTPAITCPLVAVITDTPRAHYGFSVKGSDTEAISEALSYIPWWQQAAQARGARVLLPPRQNEWETDPDFVFSIVRAVMTPRNELLGMLEVQQSYSVLERICSKDSGTFDIVVLDAKGDALYPANAAAWHSALASACSSAASGVLDLPEPHLYASCPSNYTGLVTMILRPRSDVYRAASLTFHFITYMLLLVLVLSLSAVLFASHRVTAPMRKLRASVEAMDPSHLSLAPHTIYTDEVAMLSRSFERMVARINTAARQKAQAEQAEMRAVLMALQSQMQPHFLYNTLSTMAAIADESSNAVIVSMCQDLASMLRYSSDYECSQAPLSSEIQHALEYLSLLKRRYEDSLSFEIEHLGDIEHFLVPKLIMQPLVENSYRHGLSDSPHPWRITVHAQILADGFQFGVTDNGRGFTPEAKAHLLSHIQAFVQNAGVLPEWMEAERSHVGLLNTYARLYLAYGDCISLHIDCDTLCRVTFRVRVQQQKGGACT